MTLCVCVSVTYVCECMSDIACKVCLSMSVNYVGLTCIMLNKLLNCVELRAGCDVISTIVQFSNLIVLYMIPLIVIIVTNGE